MEVLTITIIIIAVAFPLWTILAVLVGFRMGRQVSGQPMAPIIQQTHEPAGFDEDPYFEPMNGRPQSKSTVEG